MPPPMPNPSKRMTANPLKPVRRYRPGKPAAQEQSSDEEDAYEEDTQATRPSQRQPPSRPPGAAVKRRDTVTNAESEDEEGFVTEEEEVDDLRQAEAAGSRQHSSADGPTDTTAPTSETSEDEDSSDEDSEDQKPKLLRPTFIKKAARTLNTSTHTLSASSGRDAIEDASRQEMADLMIKDKLERDAAARAAGKKYWDDDDDVPEDMVDDTDGLDPDAELAAWKLRELRRLKRDREAIEAREREIQEIERRRNLTPAERKAEDAEHLSKQKEAREGRGQAGFLQRYHHKGAFFQDDETAEILRKRDLMGAKFVDEVQNREALPQYMQIRDMTKLGKKGRTRYTDLRGEDTGRWGEYARNERGMRDGMNKGVDERFQPDRRGEAQAGPTGANTSAVRDRDRDRDRDRKRRSPSPHHDRDKRRRIEAV